MHIDRISLHLYVQWFDKLFTFITLQDFTLDLCPKHPCQRDKSVENYER